MSHPIEITVLIDFSKVLHRVAVDPERRLGEVESGCALDTLRKVAEQHHHVWSRSGDARPQHERL